MSDLLCSGSVCGVRLRASVLVDEMTVVSEVPADILVVDL